MRLSVGPLGVVAVVLAAACDETPPASFPQSLDAQLRRAIGQWNVVPIGNPPLQDTALIALGRALVRDPQLFLFDEPLSSVDARLREHMRVELRKIHQARELTSGAFVPTDRRPGRLHSTCLRDARGPKRSRRR